MCRTHRHGFGSRHLKKAHDGTQSAQQSPRKTPQKPLKIIGNIRLGKVEIRGTVQFFAIDVFPGNGGAPWRVMRRYTHFRELAEKLGFENVPARFPSKFWSDCDGLQLERRRQGLETWLSQAITSSRKHQHWIPVLRSFLERSAYRAPKFSPGPAVTPQDSASEHPLDPVREDASQPTSSQESLGSQDQVEGPAKFSVVRQLNQIELQSGAVAKQFLNVVVPKWQSLLTSVETKMPQVCEAYKSAVAQSKVLDMLD